MDDFMNVERNPITKILGQESDIDVAGVSMNDAVGFFFVVSVLRGVKGGNWATRLVRTLIRCYAALAFVMPLMLGGLPSDGMKNMDKSAWLVSIMLSYRAIAIFITPRTGSGTHQPHVTPHHTTSCSSYTDRKHFISSSISICIQQFFN